MRDALEKMNMVVPLICLGNFEPIEALKNGLFCKEIKE